MVEVVVRYAREVFANGSGGREAGQWRQPPGVAATSRGRRRRRGGRIVLRRRLEANGMRCGQIGSQLPADAYARYVRARGHEVLVEITRRLGK